MQFRGKQLAELCHRLAISAEAGIDLRRTLAREADAARGHASRVLETLRDGAARGDTLEDSLARTGDAFPALFKEMVAVGEQTGSLAEVFRKLGEHYATLSRMRRTLLAEMTWPALQLCAAVAAVGGVIAVIAALDLRLPSGKPVDVMGFGVSGWQALPLYVLVVAGLGAAIAAVGVGVLRGWLWVWPIERLLMATPRLGPSLQKVCLARLCWALHLLLNTETDLRRVVPLALRATGSRYYTQFSAEMTRLVVAGAPLSQACALAGVFPPEFVQHLEVGEESGSFVESLGRTARVYEEESHRAFATLNTLVGGGLLLLVLVVVGLIIIRLVKVIYIDLLYDQL